MSQNEKNCNGVYLNLDCLDALFQLDTEDAMFVLHEFFELRRGAADFETIFNGLNSDAQRCAFVMLDRFSRPEA